MTDSTEPIASCNLPQPTEEMQNELGIGSASSIDRNRKKPDGTRRGKAKARTRAFRVFEPLSRSNNFLDLLLDIGQNIDRDFCRIP